MDTDIFNTLAGLAGVSGGLVAVAAYFKKVTRSLRDDLMGAITASEGRLEKQIGTVKTDLEKQIGTVKADLERQIGTVKTDLERQIGTVKADLERQIGTVKTDLERQIGRMDVLQSDVSYIRGRLFVTDDELPEGSKAGRGAAETMVSETVPTPLAANR